MNAFDQGGNKGTGDVARSPSGTETSAVETNKNNTFDIPSIELPKGGGSIRGIGEKFAANPVTGTGSMSVPIGTSPGRAGFGPELSLSYDSGAGNGIFGFGWNLSLPSITRKTEKGLPRYLDADDSDIFLLSGAEDLVPSLAPDGTKDEDSASHSDYTILRYRPRVEGLFARIERWTRKNDSDVHWRSISRDNSLTIYGKDANSRIVDPENPNHVFSWLICETRDDKGNAIIYDYRPDDGTGVDLSQAHERNRGKRDDKQRAANRYLKRIRYGNEKSLLINKKRPHFVDALVNNTNWMFEAVFDYGEHGADAPKPDDNNPWLLRKDTFSTFRAGFEVRTTRLCQRILMFHHFPGEDGVGANCLVRSTDFRYSHQEPQHPIEHGRSQSIYTFLNKVTQNSYRGKNGQINNGYIKRNLPPIEFEYSIPAIQNKVESVDKVSLENLPIGVDGEAYQWTDLHGEGIPGILSEQGGNWWYKRNISPINKNNVEFSSLERVATRPNSPLASGTQFMDLDGNGQLDLVKFDGPNPGFFSHDRDEGWLGFESFESNLNRDFRDPNLKFIDLTGDGHADVLVSEDQAYVWYASLASAGFAPYLRVAQALDEEAGPRLVFADGTDSIFTADMSGDGLTDLVRIRNGEVCYWPNLGYCRFGAMITMDSAPVFDHGDQFEPGRLRVGDIDGSGTIDMIYLHGDGVRLYFNQSGNSWSEPKNLNVHPKVDEISNIAVTDLLGNGTACLVWSSPLPASAQRQMRYVNLMGGQKPHLLIKTINNLGAETEIEYAPSTKFYLTDKTAGKPWVTKLPFPVHVVEKTTTTDKWRNTSFSTSYSYHHGYFDGVEREFRGFGRVEQIDIETYGEFTAGNVNSPYITDDKKLFQPPIKSVTWFHTGHAIDRDRVVSHYEDEYFTIPGGFVEDPLPEPDIKTQPMDAEEWREAMRACKGMPLRQEVYELDVDALERGEQRPTRLFSTAYHNCNIQMLQGRASNQYGVFMVTESETITYQYDLDLRDPAPTADPRIAHTLNLNIDEYGNVLQAIAAVYPRLGDHNDVTLSGDANQLINQVQKELHINYSETLFTNDVDDVGDTDNYRLRLPCEALAYEITGVTPTDTHFKIDEFKNLRLSKFYLPAGIEPVELAYHEIPNRINLEKRKIEHARMLFFHEDMQTHLNFEALNHLGLPFETYTLALTDDLLDAVFDTKLSANVRLDLNDANKSGYLSGGALAVKFGNSPGQYWVRSGIAGFANDAADHFFLPEKYTDPFGNISKLKYDDRDLFIANSEDPLGNLVSIEKFDYRVLAPREVKDINDNFSEVVFDTLGFSAAVAVKGKGNEADNLIGFSDELVDPPLNARAAFFEEPFSRADARTFLGNATARHIYDFGEKIEQDGSLSYGHRPASASGIVREKHLPQAPPGGSPLQVLFEYSDGGGGELGAKVQAEPEIAGGPLRWIASGKTVLNNKGNPVKQYEPYFSNTHSFEEPVETGVTPVMYYDAADRLIRTEFPDGTISRAEFSSWHVSSFDANDTVLDLGNKWFEAHSAAGAGAEKNRAAEASSIHANTPGQTFLDSLGRDVISIEHNKLKNAVEGIEEEKYLTFTKLDAEGKPLWIRDARGNLVMQYLSPPVPNDQANDPVNGFVPCYDIAGNLLFQHSMDGGDRWVINDATGQPFYAWDENENEDGNLEQRRYHTTYDALRRPLELRLQIDAVPPLTIERFKYGEGENNDKSRGLRGQLFEHYDSSGLLKLQRFDFKGNLLEADRQLAVFSTNALIDWPQNPNPNRLDETYTQTIEYDALDRMVSQENWHINGRTPAIYTPEYNKRGALISETLSVNGQVQQAISDIRHDAKGQRISIRYGNDTFTTYKYDPESFRLLNLKTTNSVNDDVLQDLHYCYDPVGNITEIRDDAQQAMFFKNAQITPISTYRYDALYRLIKATGREKPNGADPPKAGKMSDSLGPSFPVTDLTQRNYTEHYQYDGVGNILQMQHAAGTGSWTRDYKYEDDSNRLQRTWLGGNEAAAIVYNYDTHGSMQNLANVPHEYRLRWDHNDMIHNINLGGGGEVFYAYGSDKQRSRKRIEDGNIVKERLYLGGMERYRRWVGGVLKEEIETHHLVDSEQKVLIVEDVLSTDNANLDVGILHRYQYSNHLGSVGLELDLNRSIISYEEYHPYGTTAFSANNKAIKATRKRYRFTGMERDAESGLSYHSARYYLPWLGRWGCADPAGVEVGINLYRYTKNSPLTLIDHSGLDDEEPELVYSGSYSKSETGRFQVQKTSSGPYDDISIKLSVREYFGPITYALRNYGGQGGNEPTDFEYQIVNDFNEDKIRRFRLITASPAEKYGTGKIYGYVIYDANISEEGKYSASGRENFYSAEFDREGNFIAGSRFSPNNGQAISVDSPIDYIAGGIVFGATTKLLIRGAGKIGSNFLAGKSIEIGVQKGGGLGVHAAWRVGKEALHAGGTKPAWFLTSKGKEYAARWSLTLGEKLSLQTISKRGAAEFMNAAATKVIRLPALNPSLALLRQGRGCLSCVSSTWNAWSRANYHIPNLVIGGGSGYGVYSLFDDNSD